MIKRVNPVAKAQAIANRNRSTAFADQSKYNRKKKERKDAWEREYGKGESKTSTKD